MFNNKYRKYLKSDTRLTKYATDKIKKEIERRENISDESMGVIAMDSVEMSDSKIMTDSNISKACSSDFMPQCSSQHKVSSVTNDHNKILIFENNDANNVEDSCINENIAMNVFAESEIPNESFIDEWDSDDELYEMLENFVEDTQKHKSFQTESNLFETISIKIEKAPAEILLMVLKYAIANRLSMLGIVNLLKMMNCICDKKIIPDSRYLIDKLCSLETKFTLHGVCPICYNYIGKFEELGQQIDCKACDSTVDASNPSSSCFFAVIDPSNAVRDLLEAHDIYYDYVVRDRFHEKGDIRDIYDGKMYRNFVKTLSNENKHAYVTTLFNTDGAPVFESSTFSVWPLYIIPNEIPMEDRMKSSIVCGLYFGNKKPEMHIFLDVFVDMINRLSTVGIPCTIKNQDRCIKLYALVACVDTVARSPMNGTTQFNGKWGCDWCLHPGQYYGGSMRYPFMFPVENRNEGTWVNNAQEAVEKNSPVFGVRNVSPLLRLYSFDIVHGFTPDYMHCILAGVTSQYTEMILTHYTKEDIIVMDDLLKKIKAPNHIGRLTRPLSERSKWKAREWENWLLYYSVPVLEKIVNKQVFDHWLLLVEATYICLQSHITLPQLNRANELLYKFVSEMEDTFSLNAMTYNVHQLLHIVESVYDWGPLWAHSTFPFESANHKLLNAIHSAKGVIPQVIRYLNIQRYVQKLEKKLYPDCSSITIQFCENIICSRAQKYCKIGEISYFGRGKSVPSSVRQIIETSNSAKIFSKVVIRGCLFATSEKINSRSCNYLAQLKDGRFIKIMNFIVDFENQQELTDCDVIITRASIYNTVIREVVEYSTATVIETGCIDKVCIFVNTNEKSYIIPVPNMLSY